MPPTLLVLDLQQGLIEGDPSWGPRSTPNLTENVSQILKSWRAHHWPLIHVHHDDANPEHPLRADKPQYSKPHVCSTPIGDEAIFTKGVGCSFPAFAHLTRQGTKQLLIIGMDGSQCVNNNARHASDLGMEVTVVSDACASYGMWDYRHNAKLTAQETNDLAMVMLSNGYANILTTKELLEKFDGDKDAAGD